MPNFNQPIEERIGAYEGEPENKNLKCFREQFQNITMKGNGWYREYLSQHQKNQWESSTYTKLDFKTNQEVVSKKHLTQLTDWYSPTLKCFFDFKMGFTYLKDHSVKNYCVMTKLFKNLGHTSYFIWYEVEGRRLQWYVINACKLWEDINNDPEWDYYWNLPTKEDGGWDTNWMHITDTKTTADGLIRLINRHKTTFEDEFINI